MNSYKISLFRLGMLLPAYLIFNYVYSIIYNSAGFAFYHFVADILLILCDDSARKYFLSLEISQNKIIRRR